ncbi:MAG TPA: hypothetical protein VFW23_12615, partial [Tepidisphaeraceae bacterium]|nr:hypothetical protein [Tepidisphaeraceae bacterium]
MSHKLRLRPMRMIRQRADITGNQQHIALGYRWKVPVQIRYRGDFHGVKPMLYDIIPISEVCMAISLSAETQRLIEEQMRETGVNTADELVRVALQTLHQTRGDSFEALDSTTRAAIEEGLAQAERGEG